MEINGSIKSKGLDKTGFTEQDVSQLFSSLGSSRMAIVELRSDKQEIDMSGARRVTLAITDINPVPIDDKVGMDEYLRRLAKTLDYNRRVKSTEPEDQAYLEGVAEPTPLKDILQQGSSFIVPEALEVTDPDGDPDGQPELGSDED